MSAIAKCHYWLCDKRVNFMQANTVLSKNQAATQLSISVQTLDKMFKRGELPRIQISTRRVGVLQSDINLHLENRRATA
jgi:predicted DNA-binding transcriptional regulator AlpA